MKSLFTYSDLQELAEHLEKVLSIRDQLSKFNFEHVNTFPSNINNEDLRKEAKVLDFIIQEMTDISDKIDFLLNYVDVSEKNIDESLELFQKSAEAWKK